MKSAEIEVGLSMIGALIKLPYDCAVVSARIERQKLILTIEGQSIPDDTSKVRVITSLKTELVAA